MPPMDGRQRKGKRVTPRNSLAKNVLAPLTSYEKWVMGAYVGMIAAWLFDFRTEAGGGNVLQLAFLVICVSAISAFIATERRVSFHVPGLRAWVAATFVFTLVGVLAGVFRDNNSYEVFRMALGPLLYLAGGLLTVRVIAQIDLARIRRTLSVLCLMGLFSGLIVAGLQGGLNLETVRFQIIGASIPLALGYGTVVVMFPVQMLELATAGVGLMVVFLSVTRSYLLAIAAELLPLWPQFKEMITPRFIMGAFLAVLAGALFLSFDSSGLDRWNQRLNGGQETARGEDFTWLTRKSENDYMIDHFTDSVGSFIFGNGIAAHTTYYNPKEAGGGAEFSIGFGHNQHISQLFVAGALGGLPLLILQFSQAFGGMAFLFRLAIYRKMRSDALFLAAWGASGLIVMVTGNMFSSTFGGRATSLWYGIATGLYLGGRAVLNPRNAQRTVTAAVISPPTETSAGTVFSQPGPSAYVPPAVQRRRQALAWLRQSVD